MPQMAPISWLSLFIMFSVALIIFSALNYFCFLPKTPKMNNIENKTSSIPMNWKW